MRCFLPVAFTAPKKLHCVGCRQANGSMWWMLLLPTGCKEVRGLNVAPRLSFAHPCRNRRDDGVVSVHWRGRKIAHKGKEKKDLFSKVTVLEKKPKGEGMLVTRKFAASGFRLDKSSCIWIEHPWPRGQAFVRMSSLGKADFNALLQGRGLFGTIKKAWAGIVAHLWRASLWSCCKGYSQCLLQTTVLPFSCIV